MEIKKGTLSPKRRVTWEGGGFPLLFTVSLRKIFQEGSGSTYFYMSQ